MSDEQVSLGEVYRLCQRIEAQTISTNGRVTALEKDAIRIKTVWSGAVLLAGFAGDYLKHKLGGGA